MSLFTSLSAQERRVWVELFANVVAVTYYWSIASKVPGFFESASPDMGWIIVKVVGLVISLTIPFTILLAVLSRSSGENEKSDERDTRIASNGNTIAYYTLAVCIVLIIGQIILNSLPVGSHPSLVLDKVPASPMVLVHFLFLSLILSSMTKSLVQLFRYRRGY